MASSSSARSSSTAAHSSSKNRSLVSIGVAFSCTRWKSAPRSGSAVSVEKCSAAEGAGAADDLLQVAELVHRLGEAGAVELRHVAGVALGERVGAALRLGEHRVDGRDGIARITVEQGIEVPADLLDFLVGDLGSAHAQRGYPARMPSSMTVR